jgi:antitoxin ParD1/3/4
MTSSLHVSLPDEMRAYVDLRTNGKTRYATPSEYVRDLIRRDMETEEERRYVFGELLKSADEIARGELISTEQLDDDLDAMFLDWEKENAKVGQ